MVKKFIYKVVLLCILAGSWGCNDYLDVKPQDGLIKQEFWKTKEHVESAVVGVYVALMEHSVVNQLFRWGELRADMVALAPAPSLPSADETMLVQGNIVSTNFVANWANIYRVINYCNLVIDNAPKARETDPTFGLETLNNKLAEVRTIRAMLYFYLVRAFGEVPLQLEGVQEDTQIVSRPKSPQVEVLNKIVSDLKFAQENAVVSYQNTAADKGRVTKWAALAILADVYLWMDNYDEADKACDEIINSNRFGLVEGAEATFFNTLYFRGNSSESIFELQYSSNYTNSFYGLFVLPKSFVANAETIDAIFPKNMQNLLLKDLRSEGVSYNPTDYTIWKYVGASATALRDAGTSVAHYSFYRFADVLLMKAEALAYLGDGVEALTYINLIRDRAKALEITRQNVDANSPSSVMEYILQERARELAFEGKRWFDVLRYAKRDNYANKSYLINVATANTPSNLVQSNRTKLEDVNSHYLPVPFNDILANKELVQNPFYK